MSEAKTEVEIEKKYLLREDGKDFTKPDFFFAYNSLSSLCDKIRNQGSLIRQAYMPLDEGMDLAKKLRLKVDFEPNEARIRQKGNEYFFTIKSKGSKEGLERNELEEKIPMQMFDNLYPLYEGKKVEKIRLKEKINGLEYEFDFYDDGRDLIVCEIEVKKHEDLEKIIDFGKDVTSDSKYKNKNLAK